MDWTRKGFRRYAVQEFPTKPCLAVFNPLEKGLEFLELKHRGASPEPMPDSTLLEPDLDLRHSFSPVSLRLEALPVLKPLP